MMFCLYCGNELVRAAKGPAPKFCGVTCRVGHYRRLARYKEMELSVTSNPTLKGILVLELFPGAGLFGKAFEQLGATVVRAPDILWGGDVRNFKGIAGKFDGVIGGPPCQFASRAAISGTKAINLIPEYLRIVEECQPGWAVMENVRESRAYAPNWDYVFLRDWDCGGLTHRRRGFWFHGLSAPAVPIARAGTPEYSVLASNWNRRGSNRIRGHLYLSPQEAARLQGFDGLADKIRCAQPGWLKNNGRHSGVSEYSRDVLATHMIGNGVPNALGLYVAKHVALSLAFSRINLPKNQPETS